MNHPLSSESFERLLERLGNDRDEAALGYELLRIRLHTFFATRGCSDASIDGLVDETITRVADRVLRDGEKIRINEFSLGVARYVWIEFRRESKEIAYGGATPEIPVNPEIAPIEDDRTGCLRQCLAKIRANETDLKVILGYYDEDDRKLIEQRKLLAEELGISPVNLRVRAHRLRAKLEKCVKSCLKRKE